MTRARGSVPEETVQNSPASVSGGDAGGDSHSRPEELVSARSSQSVKSWEW